MIIDFITQFARYLSKQGMPVAESSLKSFFLLANQNDLSIADEETLLHMLSITLAKSNVEAASIEKFFYQFLKQVKTEGLTLEREDRDKEALSKKQKELEEQKAGMESDRAAFEKAEEDTKKKLSLIAAEKEKRRQQIKEDVFSEHTDPSVTEKKLKQLKKQSTGIPFPAALKPIVKALLQKEEYKLSKEQIEKAKKDFLKFSESLLRKGKFKEAEVVMQYVPFLQKVEQKEMELRKIVEQKTEADCQDLKQKEETLKKELKEKMHQQKKEQERYQKNLRTVEQLMNRIKKSENEKMKLTQKSQSLQHRPEFFGKNAVQLTEAHTDPVFQKNFKQLTEKEKQELYYYIRRNLLAFKTRMTRNIFTGQRRTLNLEHTIAEAMRTGGLPMKLLFDQPKRNKADLVLVLDVSGSCKKASELMLNFIGLLKSVFPRGCKAFAFVNSLYDISDIYETDDIETAVDEVLKMIPRSGQYSNYEVPLRMLWEENKKAFTKDTTVIFIGDARNNKNGSGEEYIKNISRRCKHAYWLNTEDHTLWNTADSIASVYGKYALMQQVTTPSELISFINYLQ